MTVDFPVNVRISVQQADFSLEQEAAGLRERSSNTGALVTFTGLVRDLHGGTEVTGLFLEHYPGMTERSLADIVVQAQARWPLQAVTVIHRIGLLQAGAQIVFVGVSSAHRHAAFAACEFIMDYLKTRAPFWKKEERPAGARWVDARDSDEAALAKWE